MCVFVLLLSRRKFDVVIDMYCGVCRSGECVWRLDVPIYYCRILVGNVKG